MLCWIATRSLTMFWYLTDGNERTGATWIVPGSHRDHRNPRGPHDGMTVSAPIPGELQVVAPKGSVFMQDVSLSTFYSGNFSCPDE